MNVKIKIYRKNIDKPIIVTDVVESFKEYESLVNQIGKLKNSGETAQLEFFDDLMILDFSEIDAIMISKPIDHDLNFDDDKAEDKIDIVTSSDAEEESVTNVAAGLPVHEGKSKKKEPVIEKPYSIEDQQEESVDNINLVAEKTLEEIQELIEQEEEKEENQSNKFAGGNEESEEQSEENTEETKKDTNESEDKGE